MSRKNYYHSEAAYKTESETLAHKVKVTVRPMGLTSLFRARATLHWKTMFEVKCFEQSLCVHSFMWKVFLGTIIIDLSNYKIEVLHR